MATELTTLDAQPNVKLGCLSAPQPAVLETSAPKLLELINKFHEEFYEWYMTPAKEGQASIHKAFLIMTAATTEMLPDDPVVQKRQLIEHGGYLGRANALMPKCQEWMQKGVALWSEALDQKGYSATTIKKMTDGKMAEVSKVYWNFNRLSATLTHRGDWLRTLISYAKAEMGQLPGGPA